MEWLKTVSFALRNILKNPGFAATFILTLGLGIGANTAIFSVVYGVLLRPLPYPDAERIMYLRQPAEHLGVSNMSFSFVEVADYRLQAKTIDELVEFGNWTFNVLGQGDPHRAKGGLVTSNFFSVLGLNPMLGRTLNLEDEDEGTEPVVVLTYEYWSRVFGGDTAVLGKILDLTVKKARIVGILEPGSHYAAMRRQDFYVNYACNDHYLGAAMQDDRLVGAGLLLRSLVELQSVDPGFELESVLTMDAPDYRGLESEQREQFANSIVEQLEGFSGVASAAVSSHVPLQQIGVFNQAFRTREGDQDPKGPFPPSVFQQVTPGYFSTIGAALLRGRDFSITDEKNSTPVAILSQTMAKQYFGDDDPLGREISIGQRRGQWLPWLTSLGLRLTSSRKEWTKIAPKPSMSQSARASCRPESCFELRVIQRDICARL